MRKLATEVKIVIIIGYCAKGLMWIAGQIPGQLHYPHQVYLRLRCRALGDCFLRFASISQRMVVIQMAQKRTMMVGWHPSTSRGRSALLR